MVDIKNLGAGKCGDVFLLSQNLEGRELDLYEFENGLVYTVRSMLVRAK